jgi:hypothetical protein
MGSCSPYPSSIELRQTRGCERCFVTIEEKREPPQLGIIYTIPVSRKIDQWCSRVRAGCVRGVAVVGVHLWRREFLTGRQEIAPKPHPSSPGLCVARQPVRDPTLGAPSRVEVSTPRVLEEVEDRPGHYSGQRRLGLEAWITSRCIKSRP